MASADSAINAAKWIGIGAAALGVAYVLYRVVKLGEGVGDALSATVSEAKQKIGAVVERIKDPSGGTAHGSIIDEYNRSADPASPAYEPDWRKRPGVTVNQYGDYGYGDTEYSAPNGEPIY
jgi:hypothetical protein